MGCGCGARSKNSSDSFTKILERKYQENINEFYPGIHHEKLDMEILDITSFQNARDSITQQSIEQLEKKSIIIKNEIEKVFSLINQITNITKISINKTIESLKVEICYAESLPEKGWISYNKDKYFVQIGILGKEGFNKLRTKKIEPSQKYWFELLKWEKRFKTIELQRKERKKIGLMNGLKIMQNDQISFEVCKKKDGKSFEIVGTGFIAIKDLFDQELNSFILNINLVGDKREWITLIIRAQLIYNLPLLLDNQQKAINQYNELLIKTYEQFVKILNTTPRNTFKQRYLNSELL